MRREGLKVVKTEIVKEDVTFNGMKVVGDHTLLQREYETVLSVNWEGNVSRVITNSKLEHFDKSWFLPSDKGGLSLFLVDKLGKVFAGLVYYEQDNELVVVSKKDTSVYYDLDNKGGF